MKVKRGDVIYLNRPLPMQNHLQGGNRPYVVISNDKGNFHSEVCVIVPLTTAYKKHLLPTHTRVSYHNSLCLCEQLFTVSQSDIETIKYHLNYEDVRRINRCLKSSLELEPKK